MSDAFKVAIFCEDIAHERFLDSMVSRCARESARKAHIRTVSARGGHGRAINELKAFQSTREPANLLIVAIDSNCKGWTQARADIEAEIDQQRFPSSAVACPDLHVERWYLADPQGLKESLNVRVTLEKRKCERERYKNQLVEALEEAGHSVLLSGAEFASEIVDAMDLYRAGKNEPSLKHFLDQLTAALRN
jgi:hypothetical protein